MKNNQVKYSGKCRKRGGIPFILFFFLMFQGFSGESQPVLGCFPDRPYIEVTGTAQMEVVPDEIYLQVVIREKDNRKPSLAEAEKEMFAILRQAGVNTGKEVWVKDAVTHLKDYWLKGTVARTSREYIVLLHEVAQLEKVFEAVGKSGVAELKLDQLKHSRLEEFRQEIKVKAVQAAREKAGRMAEAVGAKISTVLYIKEEPDWGIREAPNAVANVYFKADGGEIGEKGEIAFEKILVKASVRVCFAL